MPADPSRWPQRAGLIADLLPPAVAAVESAGHLPEPGPVLFPVEEAVMHTAGPRAGVDPPARRPARGRRGRGWPARCWSARGWPAGGVLGPPAVQRQGGG